MPELADGSMTKPIKAIRKNKKKKGNQLMIPWLYDLVLWTMSVLIDLFFREVHPRGAWKVPRQGPIILVAAPHANQVWRSGPQQDIVLTATSLLTL
jgi:hypothetical protein